MGLGVKQLLAGEGAGPCPCKGHEGGTTAGSRPGVPFPGSILSCSEMRSDRALGWVRVHLWTKPCIAPCVLAACSHPKTQAGSLEGCRRKPPAGAHPRGLPGGVWQATLTPRLPVTQQG